MKSNIDTLCTAGINFSCLLCLRRQRLQKICTRSTVAFLGYFDYSALKIIIMACFCRISVGDIDDIRIIVII